MFLFSGCSLSSKKFTLQQCSDCICVNTVFTGIDNTVLISVFGTYTVYVLLM